MHELQTFLAIVDTGSLVRASTTLHVTQSTVTARLKSLEEEIGQTLVNRSKSGITLTAAGIKMHRYALTISNLWQQAKQETGLPAGTSGLCNIACEFDLWPNLVERFFYEMQRRHPEIAVSLWLGSQGDVARWLDEGKSDLAFTYRSAISQQQGQLTLKPDNLVLVSSVKDGPTRFDPNYVFVEAGEAFGRDHAEAYADAGTARINFGNASIGLQHILQHGGSAYLPSRMVAKPLQKEQLFLLEKAPDFERNIYLNYNSTARETFHWLDEIIEAYVQT